MCMCVCLCLSYVIVCLSYVIVCLSYVIVCLSYIIVCLSYVVVCLSYVVVCVSELGVRVNYITVCMAVWVICLCTHPLKFSVCLCELINCLRSASCTIRPCIRVCLCRCLHLWSKWATGVSRSWYFKVLTILQWPILQFHSTRALCARYSTHFL